MRGKKANASGWSRKGKKGAAFTPRPFGGPRSHGRNGGLFFSCEGPQRHIPLSLLEGFAHEPRPRSAFAARSRSTDWPDRNEPPRP
ncbi:hypothetical protein CRENBAI_005755, partial [Crenichthys baileyi]